MSRITNRDMWKKHIANQRSSGLSRKKWCDANDINFHTFAYWVSRLKKDSIVIETNNTEWATVVPKALSISDNSNALSVSIGKAVIDVPINSSMESFEKIVQVLVKYV